MNVSLEEKILIAVFLCSDNSNEVLEALRPELNEKVGIDLKDKCSMFNTQFSILNVFPWKEELSEAIDHEKFCSSFFKQPALFLRLRPGKEKIVVQKLHQAGIDHKIISDSCLALPNSSKIDEIIELDKEAVIQDYNSQMTGRFLSSASGTPRNEKPSVWDCCAGSGGKSIMAYDIDPKIDLTVSDVRESILANLRKRFEKAGIKNYKSFVADISGKDFKPQPTNFKLIIADVPCTGSGTWSRTPEQLYFFDEDEIKKYSSLQKKIITNVIPYLKPGGSFIYITCSVFKRENEEAVDFIKEKFHLQLKQMELLKGYDKNADSMFIAVFERSS